MYTFLPSYLSIYTYIFDTPLAFSYVLLTPSAHTNRQYSTICMSEMDNSSLANYFRLFILTACLDSSGNTNMAHRTTLIVCM